MTDRELLELAAKAAGLHLTWGEKYKVGNDEVDCTDLPYALGDSPDEAPSYWNPLADDGDALRLAVKLRITIEHPDPRDLGGGYVISRVCGYRYRNLFLAKTSFVEDVETSFESATRRAIVRAAAEIGKGMT